LSKKTFTYQIVEGTPKEEVLNKLLNLYKIIFEDARLDFFRQRIQEKEHVIICLCFYEKVLVGFKVGYHYNETTLYSWVGGVLENYRKNGIANQLTKLQHTWAKTEGYQKVRTKSMNRFKPMMILNLKNGFDIVKVYTNNTNQTKIIFEKTFID